MTGSTVGSAKRCHQPSYFLAIRCGFFSLDCRRLPGLRLGLLITKVPLP